MLIRFPRVPGPRLLRARATALTAVLVLLMTGVLASGALPGPTSSAPAHAATTQGSWITPVPGMEIVRAYDPPEHAYGSGHRGIDVASLPAEPVRAPAFGTVHFAGMVAGRPVVSLRVGSRIVSYEPVVTKLEAGTPVFPGMPIGLVGVPPHCASGCLHVGVRSALSTGRQYEDPAPLFAMDPSILLPEDRAPAAAPVLPASGASAGGAAGAWGGHRNGRIPQVALCAVTSAAGHSLRCDAARAFDALAAAFEADFGRPISVTDSYRDYDTQVILKQRKGRFAATPGTSNHGWGLAMDLGGGINTFGSAEHEWMRANGPAFGWVHPSWAGAGGSLPEPWHWEFAG
ncbi:D-alanyl-D-alanine carboxypeptidase family protein [Brevibacterium samyangense]|uniref:D-alanyl-D-alanine carboxypeptidase-like core domain-containing protein n=1 Tax=Brevibacterium samyangense TaxID=366888 RepID=A0ABN2TCA1_9MICO